MPCIEAARPTNQLLMNRSHYSAGPVGHPPGWPGASYCEQQSITRRMQLTMALALQPTRMSMTEHSVSWHSLSHPADPMPFGIPDDQVDFDTPSAAALAGSNFPSTPPGPVPARQNSTSPAQARDSAAARHAAAGFWLHPVVHSTLGSLQIQNGLQLTVGCQSNDAITGTVARTRATITVVTL